MDLQWHYIVLCGTGSLPWAFKWEALPSLPGGPSGALQGQTRLTLLTFGPGGVRAPASVQPWRGEPTSGPEPCRGQGPLCRGRSADGLLTTSKVYFSEWQLLETTSHGAAGQASCSPKKWLPQAKRCPLPARAGKPPSALFLAAQVHGIRPVPAS